MRLVLLAAIFASPSYFSLAFVPSTSKCLVQRRIAFDAVNQHVGAACPGKHDPLLTLSMSRNSNFVNDENRKKIFTVFTAASIFLASSAGGTIVPVEHVHAATAPDVTNIKTTKPTAAVSPQPLSKEKQAVADAETKVAAGLKVVNAAEKDLKQAKAVEVKATEAVASAQTKVRDAKNQFLTANDNLAAATRQKQQGKTLEKLVEKVEKAKESLTAAESVLAKAKAAKSSASKEVSEKEGVVSQAERSLKSAKSVSSDARKRLENASIKIKKDKEAAEKAAEKERKASAEREKQQKKKEQKEAAEKKKQDKIKAEKKRQQDEIAAKKAAKAAKEKAALEKRKKEAEAKAVKEAEAKLKELVAKKQAYERNLAETSKAEKKLDSDITSLNEDLKKLKAVAAK